MTLSKIVDNGLCIGCGLCESLTPESIQMVMATNGQLRPKVVNSLAANDLDRIKMFCPGIVAQGPKAETGATMHTVWGPIFSTHKGWAADENVRFTAAAGGALTALGIYLLGSKKVDCVVHVRASTENPLLTEAHVSRTKEEVSAGAQSRYGPAPVLRHIYKLLDAGECFAVIAKPCDITAIRNLAAVDARVEKQILYCLSIFCGGVPNYRTAQKIVAYHGVQQEEVAVFRFRGNGWPGPTRVETHGGSRFDLSYDQTWYGEDYPWKYDIQFRCKICPDAIGEQSDVACPDGWKMRNGHPIHEEASGENLFVARTRRGQTLIEEAQADGAIVLEPMTITELDRMHRDHYPRKLGANVRVMALRSLGQLAPDYYNFRRWKSILKSGFLNSLRTFLGARKRIKNGANKETPIN